MRYMTDTKYHSHTYNFYKVAKSDVRLSISDTARDNKWLWWDSLLYEKLIFKQYII